MEVLGMVPTRLTIHTPASTPAIDASEVTWAADEVAALLRRATPDSVVGMVLTQTLRELASLKQSAGEVVGPFRVKAA
jgi:hypothetical protein